MLYRVPVPTACQLHFAFTLKGPNTPFPGMGHLNSFATAYSLYRKICTVSTRSTGML